MALNPINPVIFQLLTLNPTPFSPMHPDGPDPYITKVIDDVNVIDLQHDQAVRAAQDSP